MSKNLKAGIIALISLGGFIFLINFLKGKHFFDKGIVLYAIYENVNGLETTKPVTINGMKVGRVNSIRFTDDDSGKLLVEMTINSQFKFDKNTKAVIYDADLMSGAQIKLELSHKGAPVKEGDYLIGVSTPNLVAGFSNKIIPLKDKLENVLVNIDSTLNVLKKLGNAENRKNLSKLIEDLDKTILSYQKVAILVYKTSESVNELSVETKEVLSENRTKVRSALNQIDATLNQVNQMVKKINQSAPDKAITKLNTSLTNLNEIINKIKTGKGSLGKLIEDESVYNNFEQATKELSLLLKDLRENPKRYVHFSIFGRKNKPYKDKKIEDISKK